MSMDYLTPESDEVKQAFVRLGQIERALCRAAENYVPPIREERYLTGRDVCDCLHISPRTLQTLRDTRQIPYTAVSDRVFLYPEAGIMNVLIRNLRPAEDR